MFSFVDVDECAIGNIACTCGALDVFGCGITCLDTPGSYACGCSTGFVLETDLVTCIGEH